MNKLGRIDLNLMVTLHALLEEKHISRAALRLHKSQPAVSHALAHLRRIFNDPLLIRRANQLELSSRAIELVQPLQQALAQLDGLLDPSLFDPSQAQRQFHLAMSDYGARLLLPDLTRQLRTTAPHVDLVIHQASREAMLAGVMNGEIDLALGVFPNRHPDELIRQTLFQEHFVSVADSTTLPSDHALDLTEWLARPHLLVAMRSSIDNEIDQALRQQGHQRRIAVTLPHWGVATDLLTGTDLILTIAERSTRHIQQARHGSDSGLTVFQPPIDIPPFDLMLTWHQRREADPAHRWLREQISGIITGSSSCVSAV